MTEPTSDLVKALEERASDQRERGWELMREGNPLLLEKAAARIRALEAEVGRLKTELRVRTDTLFRTDEILSKQKAETERIVSIYRADADRRVAEEREAADRAYAALKMIANGRERALAAGITEVVDREDAMEIAQNAIRSRSNGAEPEADTCVEKVTPPISQWRDISTAPRDGSEILVATLGQIGSECAAFWGSARHGDEGWIFEGDRERAEATRKIIFGVTHWQPLPKAPSSDSADALSDEADDAGHTVGTVGDLIRNISAFDRSLLVRIEGFARDGSDSANVAYDPVLVEQLINDEGKADVVIWGRAQRSPSAVSEDVSTKSHDGRITETITFKFDNAEQQRRFHERLEAPDTSPAPVGDEVEELATVLRSECLAVFGSNWSNDVAMRFARAVLSHLAKRKGSGVSPPGWKLMPAEPTEEMVRAGVKENYDADREDDIYRAMYAAAPSPSPIQEQAEVSIAPEALSEGGE